MTPWEEAHWAVCARIRRAIKDLDTLPEAEGIHQFRRAIKQIRAILRLSKKAQQAPDDRSHLGKALKTLAQAATPARDLQVQMRLLKKMQAEITQIRTRKLCRFLEQRCALQLELLPPVKPRLLKGLRDALAKLEASLPEELTLKEMNSAWKREFSKTSKAGKTANANPTDEALHEWRKRAKSLGYMTQFLNADAVIHPNKLLKRLSKRSQLLGEDRDLALVEQTLSHVHSKAKKPLRIHLQESRQRFQKQLFRLKPH